MSGLQLLVGCDPELALFNPNSKKYISAEGVVPGDKLNPHKVKKGTISVDGFAAEIGTDPARTADEFVENVMTVLEELKRYTGGYEHHLVDHVIFDEDVYLGQSDKGRELGCDPDFSAYTKVQNPSPVPNPKSLRTFSGHIHISWIPEANADITNYEHFMDCVNVCKQMDWFVGVPSLWWNKGTVRRSLYGKAGAFRPKSYGVEYRTPDNGWLKNEARMRLVFNNVKAGMDRLYAGEHVYNRWNASGIIDKNSAAGLKYNQDYLRQLNIPWLDDEPKPEVKSKAKPQEKNQAVMMEEVWNPVERIWMMRPRNIA